MEKKGRQNKRNELIGKERKRKERKIKKNTKKDLFNNKFYYEVSIKMIFNLVHIILPSVNSIECLFDIFHLFNLYN